MPHRYAQHKMRPIVTVVAWSICSYVSVGHNYEPVKNGPTDRSAVWILDSGRARRTMYWAAARIPHGRGHFGDSHLTDDAL